MCQIIVTTRAARDLLTDSGNPHLIWDGYQVRVIGEGFWREHHHATGWWLIITRDELAEIDPAALAWDPGSCAVRLTDFAGDFAPADCPCA